MTVASSEPRIARFCGIPSSRVDGDVGVVVVGVAESVSSPPRSRSDAATSTTITTAAPPAASTMLRFGLDATASVCLRASRAMRENRHRASVTWTSTTWSGRPSSADASNAMIVIVPSSSGSGSVVSNVPRVPVPEVAVVNPS